MIRAGLDIADWFAIVLFLGIPVLKGIAKMLKKVRETREARRAEVNSEEIFWQEASSEKEAEAVPEAIAVQDTAAGNVPPLSTEEELLASTSSEYSFSASELRDFLRETQGAEVPGGASSEQRTGSSFDYADFLRKHGRQAVVMAEILSPPNSKIQR